MQAALSRSGLDSANCFAAFVVACIMVHSTQATLEPPLPCSQISTNAKLIYNQHTFHMDTFFTVIPLESPCPHVGSQSFLLYQNAVALPLTLSAQGLPSTPNVELDRCTKTLQK